MANFSSEQIRKKLEGYRRAPDPPRLRRDPVRLSAQPFPQPRARQHLDGCACHGRLLPHAVLAVPAVAIVFYTAMLLHFALGIWALYQRRQFSWKTVEPLQLVLGLSIPALVAAHIVGVRLAQTMFGHQKLYPQELYAFWVAYYPYKTLADVGGARRRLGAWLHRPAFLAAHEAVLQAPCAVPACGRRAGPDAGAARLLPGRPDGDGGSRRCRTGGSGIGRQQVGTAAEQSTLDSHHRRFPDRISRPARPRRAGARRARAS